jgi:hypothetical protein
MTRSRYQKEVIPLIQKRKEDARKQAEENKELAKMYWWFCGHACARIVSVRQRMHECEACPQSHDWEYFYVNGQLRTGT